MASNEWDAFLADAEKDTRVGKHEFMVTSVLADTWPSGDARFKIKGNLVTAGNAKCDMTMSAMPTLEAAQAETDPKRRRGIALSVRNHLALQQYKRAVDTIEEGDVFRVETGKDKEGFVRVNRILGPQDSVSEVKVTAGKVPF